MLQLLADEGFDRNIVDGLSLIEPSLAIVRAQDLGLTGARDPLILERTAPDGRILLTQDIKTMPDFCLYSPSSMLIRCPEGIHGHGISRTE